MRPERRWEPSLPWLVAYSLAAGVHIVGVVALLGALLDHLGSGFVLGVQAGVCIVLVAVAGLVAERVLRWVAQPWREGGDRAA